MASDGYEGIVTPYNTTQWNAIVADVRSHFNGSSGSLHTVAAILRKELPHAKNVEGRRRMAGLDLHIAAIQIARHWNQAAASQTAAAVAMTKADEIYAGVFAIGGARGLHREGRFDAGK